jgi:dihydroneopterin aldolase
VITTTTIGIKAAHFHAYHGYYEQEQLYGHTFIVDCEIQLASSPGAHDELSDTLNYEVLYQIIADEISRTKKLLETVIQAIIAKIEAQPNVAAGHVQITKVGAQLGGKLEGTVVRMAFEV